MKPWWQRSPDRLEEELAALKAAGLEVTDVHKDTGGGLLVVTFLYPQGADKLRLVAHFPIEYPWLPPSVFGPDLLLERHLHPLSKNICLLGNPDDWDIWETLAGLVTRQMPGVLSTAENPGTAESAARETHQGEPWSAYPDYPQGLHLIVGDVAAPPGVKSGRLRWKRLPGSPLRGVVMAMLDEEGNVVAETSQYWKDFAVRGLDEHGHWIRVAGNPPIDSAERHFRSVHKPAAFSMDHHLARLAVTVYPEESGWRQKADGWLVSAYARRDARSKVAFDWMRVGYGDEAQLFARTPELAAMRKKKVLVVGLGMLGSHCAIHLARMGAGQLMLADYDFVELSTTPRWALGAEFAGRLKSEALATYAAKHFPWCRTNAVNYRIGDPLADQAAAALFDRMLRDADIVVDAAAEFCVSNYLSARCQELDKPHLWLWTVPGAWGGVVGRGRSKDTACWRCLKRYMDEGAIKAASQRSEDGIQTRGCRALTATGAGFDVEEVVLTAVRLAAGTLCKDAANAYPDQDWDFAVLDLRDERGVPRPAAWTAYRKEKHRGCPH